MHHRPKITIIIPMAGRGKRISDAKIEVPKPLVKIKGKYMFEWAMKSLEFYDETIDKLIFICLKEHIKEYGIDKILKEKFPKCKIISITKVTKGQACTVLLAKKEIDENPLVIFNTDTYFTSGLKEKILDKKLKFDGIISVFDNDNIKYSYARIGQDNFIEEVAEKKVISNHATAGMYYFSKGSDFIWAADQMIKKNITVNKEFYVGPTYNELILKGKKFIIDKVESIWDLGTIENIMLFEKEKSY